LLQLLLLLLLLLLFSIAWVIKSQEADNIWKRAESVQENGLFLPFPLVFGQKGFWLCRCCAAAAAVHLPARKLFMITEIALIDCVAALGMGSPRISTDRLIRLWGHRKWGGIRGVAGLLGAAPSTATEPELFGLLNVCDLAISYRNIDNQLLAFLGGYHMWQ